MKASRLSVSRFRYKSPCERPVPTLYLERMAAKAAERAKDQADLASGAITREELAARNGAFAFPDSRICWAKTGRLA